jgi:hypothetical protein
MKRVLKPARGAIAAVLLMAGFGTAAAQGQLRQALETGERATREAERIQEQINQLDDERTDMIAEYRTLLQRKTAEELFAAQQRTVVEAQREEIASLEDQLTRVDEIAAQVTPMLIQMIDDLDAFVQADLPFKMEERTDAIDSLRAAMDRPDVTAAERYRLIIEAYQREMEYGSTFDTWQEEVNLDGNPTNVNMMLFGRTALVYMTPDRQVIKRWSRADNDWVDVEGSFREDIVKAIRITDGLAQQDVVFAPITKFSAN